MFQTKITDHFFQMLYQITCPLLFVNLVGISNAKPDMIQSVFSEINLPKDFDNDENYDKSGFIPEVDFSNFFKRVDFGRSLDDVFNYPELHHETARKEERHGEKITSIFRSNYKKENICSLNYRIILVYLY